jgi:tRNA U54 and U55 pseudouridine synthase Pus10
MSFFTRKEECGVCKAHLGRIEDLKQEIARLVKEKENERAEYKRAIDALLHKEKQLMVGQGVVEQKPFDIANALGYMDSEVQEKRS